MKLTRLFRFVFDLFSPVYASEKVEDLPDALEPKTLYLVGDRTPWAAALLCPCGCRDVIQISLIANDNPRWRIFEHTDSTMSIFPSIRRIKNCRSHFFLRRGRIGWAKDIEL